MGLELKQDVKLTQQLVMTPQLQQAIKLLQLSRVELNECVQEELRENPVLEEESSTTTEATDTEAAATEGQAQEPQEAAPAEELPEVGADTETLSKIEDWQNYLEDSGQTPLGHSETLPEDELPNYENILAAEQSLADHLHWQLQLSDFSTAESSVASAIIGNLDANGYLVASEDELMQQCETDAATVAKVLKRVQEFDPPGVAARSLTECLLAQLRHLGREDSLAARILQEHGQQVEKHAYKAIAKAQNVTVAAVEAAMEEIACLDPWPGSRFSATHVEYIVPDVYIEKVEDEYVVRLNNEGLPHLHINHFYQQALENRQQLDEQTGTYINEKMRSAMWLIKSIEQRQRTIRQVAESIVRFQREFFDYGIAYLKPLVLRDVAEDIEMHESTISRVTTNKYAQTPQGLYELKFFFNSGIGTKGGSEMSSESVKNRIRTLIAEEDPKKPLSDQKILDILKQEGLEIARRTVTKYREMLGLGSSSARRKRF